MKSLDAGALVALATATDASRAAYPRGRWTLFKNPFVARSSPVVPAAPVQGELLLDLIKPIRNDLSDSDLELIPAKASAPGAEPQAAKVSNDGADVLAMATPEVSRATSVAEENTSIPPALDPPVGREASRLGDVTSWQRVSEQLFGTAKD